MTTVGDLETETREDIPLKQGKKARWYSCNEESFSGSKYMNIAFGSLTLIITVALLIQIYYGDYQVIPHGSVATDSLDCSNIGTSILMQGGNAVDAAIASALCLSVATPHVTGLDAEGQLLIYNHRTRLPPDVIDFSSIKVSNSLPRLVLGLMYTHQQYGSSLAWKELVQPAADLARRGYLISKMLVQAVTNARAEDIFGRLEPGQLLKHENLANTLDHIANIPEKDLYGYLNEMEQPNITQALKLTFYNYEIYVPNSPSIGPMLLNNLQEAEKFNFTKDDTHKPEYIYRLAQTTQLLYKEQNISGKFHEGTFSNVAVIDTNDNYVSLVTGLYRFFGTGEMTSHGYVLDVKNPDGVSCSRVPLIVTDSYFICGRRLIFGANDISIATQMIAALVIAEKNATESVESPRFHIISNGSIGIEESHLPAFNDEVLAYLDTLPASPLRVSEPYQSSNLVEKIKDDLKSHSDSRGGGIASRF